MPKRRIFFKSVFILSGIYSIGQRTVCAVKIEIIFAAVSVLVPEMTYNVSSGTLNPTMIYLFRNL